MFIHFCLCKRYIFTVIKWVKFMHMTEWQHAIKCVEFDFYILSFFMEINLKCYRSVYAAVFCIIANKSTLLTHWGWVMHKCVNKLAYERFRWWLVACSVLRLYIWTSACLLLTGPLAIDFSDIWGKNAMIFLQENDFRKIISKWLPIC